MLKWFITIILCFIAQMSHSEVILTAGSYGVLQGILNEKQVLAGSKDYQPAQATKLITQKLLNTPYNSHTLNMSAFSTEKLIINLSAMDCMTFIEYTEAFKRADNYEQFITQLSSIRYINQNINFNQRRHFFTDWAQEPEQIVIDITKSLSPHTISVVKSLNLKSNGKLFISSIKVKSRLISYIPVYYVDEKLIDKLNTGDYIGIYAKDNGLDVTHVGIIIHDGRKVIFRNASSIRNNFKVSDVELERYLHDKTGIIVLRSSLDNYTDISNIDM